MCRCGTKLVKKLPNNLFISVEEEEIKAVPVKVVEVEVRDLKKPKVKSASLVCPVCGRTLVKKEF